ncbi:hypothetical protein B4166_0294 [Caldibacillus thermoamylovorans]|uniref:Uncharacterized protein n=1 Tax=Caldibacillus thermoamylovorans TaxID=35841 RepID=A0ABD4A833_9BACI|nr:hypothetical protein B4166_0294 [Caldibacillus thermoamylovorans]KIO72946.1 hypothetical protein B4167_0267 [Caldibacillus thermoamylovorans]
MNGKIAHFFGLAMFKRCSFFHKDTQKFFNLPVNGGIRKNTM